jgi:hypothetical protein
VEEGVFLAVLQEKRTAARILEAVMEVLFTAAGIIVKYLHLAVGQILEIVIGAVAICQQNSLMYKMQHLLQL